ncbi:hypothetical protein BB8028_0004g13130 [Beauveria bassiana]|uniref:Uncharacterized protein n=1 Tax=Beauveria bassiana TaxID=176275 RepID=A0A2S7YEM0_BEABA|nr:hypothetical protein BB8028_0004g13130 [Beauveria bassiana]
MNLHAAPQRPGPKSSTPNRSSEGTGPTKTRTLATSSKNAGSRVQSPKWTAKRTQRQFSFHTKPLSSQTRRRLPHLPAFPDNLDKSTNAILEHEIVAPPAGSPTDPSQRLAAGRQTTGDDQGIKSPLRMSANASNSHSPNHTTPHHTPQNTVPNAVMTGEAEYEIRVMRDITTIHVGAVGVTSAPRSFDLTNVILSSDESDAAATTDSPTVKKRSDMIDAPPDLYKVGGSTSGYTRGLAPPAEKKEPPSTPKKLPTQISVSDTGASRIGTSREPIYIDSSDEENQRHSNACSPIRSQALEESSFDMPTSKPRGISIDDICSPRSPRATSIDKNNASAEDESSYDMPISEPRATSVEDICSPETTQAPSPLFDKCNASAENEPPKNNVAVAVLRRTHVSNKRKFSESSDKTDSAVVNQPTRAPRQFAAIRGQPKRFDSDAFDAMIYCQSETQPPPGLAISRPPMTSSAGPAGTNAFPHDDRVFVSANPAIHGPVERSDKWWKDKTLEIRKRPRRKQWFGKAAERMRWLRTTQQEEEAKRRAQPRGRQTRQDPLPASYKRVMDFGDVSEDQLPTDVRNNPGWAGACAWMRSMREEDAALHRGVEYRTQRAWQHYQDILREAE